MEKFTQAPVGLDIDQTVSSNSQAIAKLSLALASLTSQSVLESKIVEIIGTMSDNERRFGVFTPGFSNSIFDGSQGEFIVVRRSSSAFMVVYLTGARIVTAQYYSSAWHYKVLTTTDDFAATQLSVSPIPTSGVSYEYASVVRSGNVITAQFRVTFDSKPSGYVTIYSGLPRPLQAIYNAIVNTTATIGGLVAVDTSGNILVNPNAAGTFFIQITYIGQ